ncbi:MAG TPA: hypothetical protein VL400_07090 [Polyangiaceae bacterium]|nr:hypothetical protein [Polyangiaceae bacterium]
MLVPPWLRGLAAFGVAASTVALLLPAASGCDGDETSACASEVDTNGCFDQACYTEGATRSFKTDVLPIFEQSCALSASCHGDAGNPEGGDGYLPYLGEVNQEQTPSDLALIFATNVGQPSHANPSMAIIDPGKPESSFLMHKMDGDLSCADLDCGADCGVSMPKGSASLSRASRDVVRDWIKQGAANN